jgi:hypothetical protein
MIAIYLIGDISVQFWVVLGSNVGHEVITDVPYRIDVK